MDDLHWFNFSALPHSEGGFSKLFTDYVNEYHKVQQYFETDFHSIHNFPKHAERLKPQIRHRAALVEVLREQNAQFGASQKTNEHIDQLAEENTFAIVTGQQVGILSGPLYTIYKTITAIKLSQLLGATFPDYKFVPVFWLEGEDHDFEEVNHVGLLNAEHTPVKVEYHPAGRNPVKNMGPVGAIEFDGSLELFFDQIRKTLPNSEFKESVLALLTGIYAAGSTFNNSFARLLNTFFPEAGLVFVSSNDKRLKQLMAPIFLKEIQQYPRVSQLIIARSAELENRYHAQIKPKAMNLFLF